MASISLNDFVFLPFNHSNIEIALKKLIDIYKRIQIVFVSNLSTNTANVVNKS